MCTPPPTSLWHMLTGIIDHAPRQLAGRRPPPASLSMARSAQAPPRAHPRPECPARLVAVLQTTPGGLAWLLFHHPDIVADLMADGRSVWQAASEPGPWPRVHLAPPSMTHALVGLADAAADGRLLPAAAALAAHTFVPLGSVAMAIEFLQAAAPDAPHIAQLLEHHLWSTVRPFIGHLPTSPAPGGAGPGPGAGELCVAPQNFAADADADLVEMARRLAAVQRANPVAGSLLWTAFFVGGGDDDGRRLTEAAVALMATALCFVVLENVAGAALDCAAMDALVAFSPSRWLGPWLPLAGAIAPDPARWVDAHWPLFSHRDLLDGAGAGVGDPAQRRRAHMHHVCAAFGGIFMAASTLAQHTALASGPEGAAEGAADEVGAAEGAAVVAAVGAVLAQGRRGREAWLFDRRLLDARIGGWLVAMAGAVATRALAEYAAD